MTFPVVAARTTTTDPSNTNSRSIGLGSPSAGDILVVFATTSGAGGPYDIDLAASGSDWTLIQAAGIQLRLGIFWKVANGSDALTLKTIASTRMVATCYRITGHGSAMGGATSFPNSTAGANVNPPSASLTGSAQDALFITALCGTSSNASAAPASYTNLTTAGIAFNVFLSTAERELNGTSDDPGSFTNTSQGYITTTVVVPSIGPPTTAARLTQEAVELLSDSASPSARLSQVSAELVTSVSVAARVTQVAVEMVSPNVSTSSSGPGMLLIAT